MENGFVRYSGIAFEMLAIVGGFTFVGWKLDRWLENRLPIFTLILSLSGVCLGIYAAISGFLKEDKRKKNNSQKIPYVKKNIL